MRQTLLTLTICVTIGAAGLIFAQHAEKSDANVLLLSRRDIAEKLDGKETKATIQEVTLKPSQEVPPHRHTGPVFGYVLEGEYEHALNDDEVETYKAGETFYEPSGCVHRVTRNPSKTQKTRLLAVILHPREAKDVTIPEKSPKR